MVGTTGTTGRCPRASLGLLRAEFQLFQLFRAGFQLFRVCFQLFRAGFQLFRVGVQLFRVAVQLFRVGSQLFRNMWNNWNNCSWVPQGWHGQMWLLVKAMPFAKAPIEIATF